jgi:hypothetical protein
VSVWSESRCGGMPMIRTSALFAHSSRMPGMVAAAVVAPTRGNSRGDLDRGRRSARPPRPGERDISHRRLIHYVSACNGVPARVA